MGRPSLDIGTYGSISTKKIRTGNWRALTRARDLDGVTRQVSAHGPNKTAAEQALKAALKVRFVGNGGLIRPETTLEQLGKVWLARIEADGKVSASSLATYKWAVGVLDGVAANVKVREASYQWVDAIISKMHAESKSKARMVRVVLGQMLGMAAKQGAIPTNPVKSLDAMSRGTKKPKALETTDIPAIRQLVTTWQTRTGPGPRDSDLGDIIDLHLATGCRIGEVLAIWWQDVDFDAGTVTVTGTLRYIPGTGLVRSPRPKTDSSYRTLRLPEFALEVLRRRVAQCDGNPEAPVFPARGGGWKTPGNVREQWRKVRANTPYEWVTPHTFRKTVATLVKTEADLGTASSVLGHSSEAVTEQHYVDKPAMAPDVTGILDAFAPVRDDPQDD